MIASMRGKKRPIEELGEPETEEHATDVAGEIDELEGKNEADQGGKSNYKSKEKFPTMEHEQDLAEFYASHPEFYDKTMDDYRDSKKKRRLLEQKAEELGITVKDITNWYCSARSSFGRIQKHKSGQAASKMTPRQRWLWQNCQFFREYIVPRTGHTTVLGQVRQPISASQSQSHDDDVESNEEYDGHTGSSAAAFVSSVSPVPITVPKAPKKKSSTVDAAILDFIKTNQTQGVHLQARIDEALTPMNEVEAWVRWMSLTLKSLPRPLWREFSDESYALVTRYVRQADAQQSSQSQQQSSQPYSQQQHPFRPQCVQQQPFQPYQQQQQPFQQQHFLALQQQRSSSTLIPNGQSNLQLSKNGSVPGYVQWDPQCINLPIVVESSSQLGRNQPQNLSVSDLSQMPFNELLMTTVGTSPFTVTTGEVSTPPMKTFTTPSSVSKTKPTTAFVKSTEAEEQTPPSQSSKECVNEE